MQVSTSAAEWLSARKQQNLQEAVTGIDKLRQKRQELIENNVDPRIIAILDCAIAEGATPELINQKLDSYENHVKGWCERWHKSPERAPCEPPGVKWDRTCYRGTVALSEKRQAQEKAKVAYMKDLQKAQKDSRLAGQMFNEWLKTDEGKSWLKEQAPVHAQMVPRVREQFVEEWKKCGNQDLVFKTMYEAAAKSAAEALTRNKERFGPLHPGSLAPPYLLGTEVHAVVEVQKQYRPSSFKDTVARYKPAIDKGLDHVAGAAAGGVVTAVLAGILTGAAAPIIATALGVGVGVGVTEAGPIMRGDNK